MEKNLIQIDIEKFLQQWNENPFARDVWPFVGEPITRDDVAHAISACNFAVFPNKDSRNREYHVRRIAFLANNGWTDHIELDLGIPSFGFIPECPIQDGYHRLAAAIFNGDRTILASVSGETDWIQTFMPSDTPDNSRDSTSY